MVHLNDRAGCILITACLHGSIPMTPLRSFFDRLSRAVRSLFVNIFGRWQWDRPRWVTWTNERGERGARYAGAHPKATGGVILAIAAAIAGYVFYASLPKPYYVKFGVTPPSLTTYTDEGLLKVLPMRVIFEESVAPLKNVRTAVTTGIDLSPALPGTWFWVSDRELQFTPKDDWPVDGAFTVKFASKGFFASPVRLEDYRLKFRIALFAATITESQFYQDPKDPNLKKLVATVSFTHPVDPQTFESHVSLVLAKDAEYLGLTPDSRNFTVAYDKFKLAAFVHSTALAMPKDDTSLTVRVD